MGTLLLSSQLTQVVICAVDWRVRRVGHGSNHLLLPLLPGQDV